jgi:hypothetical protein
MSGVFLQVGVLDSVYDVLPGMSSLSGVEFDELGPEGKPSAVQEVRLLSRVEPNHKTELITLLKAQVHPQTC